METNVFINDDCLNFMKSLPDKSIDLVLTDPPYGIGASSVKFKNGTSKSEKTYYRNECWDSKLTPEYINEIMRVSKEQIIWGYNYYADLLGCTRCFLVWDKTIHGNSYADCELAYNSKDGVSRIFIMNICNVDMDGRQHPTQKPVKLFEWCLKNYSEEGQIILDCFSGSGTTAIACHNLNRKFICIEKDKEYFKKSVERYNKHILQEKLFK